MADEEARSKIMQVAETFGELPFYSQVLFIHELAEGNTETVHHFLHGKKHGPTFRDCDLPTCIAATLMIDGMQWPSRGAT